MRALEDRVTIETGLTQAVSGKRKLDGLAAPKPDERLQTELGRWATRVHEVIAAASDPRLSAMNDPWVSSVAANPIWSGVHPYPLRLNSGAHVLDVLAASGRVAAVSRPESSDRFVCDLRQLYGLVLTMADVEPDPLTVQDSLF